MKMEEVENKEDWEIYRILCEEGKENHLNTQMESDMSHDAMTSLRSELAALQYKRDKLISELQETQTHLRSRDQRVMELQLEADQLREQVARQNAIIASLRKRIHDLEEKERLLAMSQSRTEMAMQTLQRENKFQEETISERDKKMRALEVERDSEEQMKEAARKTMHDFLRRLSTVFEVDIADTTSSSELLVQRASELVQEATRLKNRSANLSDTLSTTEAELRSTRDALERAVNDRESLQRQAASHLLELDRIRQERDSLDMQQRVTERELAECREKLASATRSLGNASGDIAAKEQKIRQLVDEVRSQEERAQKAEDRHRHFLECLSIQLSSPSRFVECEEESVKERIREIQEQQKEKGTQLEALKEKVSLLTQQLSRQVELQETAARRARAADEDKITIEAKAQKFEAEMTSLEVVRDNMRRDITTYLDFLDRLARAMNVDEISKDLGMNLKTEALLARAEQLARLESDQLVGKLLSGYRPTILRRERSFHEGCFKDTAAVYQLQRRVRTLREQLQRRDLHLDLLRRKIALIEDNSRIRSVVESERDEANARVKKLLKQVERFQLQLGDSRAISRDLKAQLADAAEYKIAALERGRKLEELQKRLAECEMLRNKYNRKVALLKDQVRETSQTAEQERSLNDHTLQLLRDELENVKQALADTSRREHQLLSFRGTVGKILGVDAHRSPVPDYEIISRLQKIVQATHEFTMVSKKFDDPRITSISPTENLSRTPDRSRYEDSGFVDNPDLSGLDDSEDLNGIYNRRPLRTST